MKEGNKIILSSNTDELSSNDVGGIEQQQEIQNVYKDLLKGEVTESVRELRHEMYYSERKSYDFSYDGNGKSKKNNMFGFKGNVENSDGYEIKLVQENSEITSSLSEDGISEPDLTRRNKTRLEKKHRIIIERDFLPSFYIENYLKKIVVKTIKDNKVLIDLYINKYYDKYEPTSYLFHNQMERIYMGEKNSNILQFDELHFITNKAYGSSDLFEYYFNNFSFETITEYDGFYVLKYIAEEKSVTDLISEFYHEPTAEKNRNKERRENTTIGFDDALNIINNKTND